MTEIIYYPEDDNSEELKNKIINLQEKIWPTDPETAVSWSGDKDTYKTSIVLLNDDEVVSHIAVVGKCIEQGGCFFEVAGLSEVVTDPEYQHKGFALKLLKEANAYIEQQACDLVVFTCKPELVSFYEKDGFSVMDAVLVGGTLDKPFRSDALGLVTMVRFLSDEAIKNKSKFIERDIILELQENNLW